MIPSLPSFRCARSILSRFVWLLLLCMWVTPVLAQTTLYTNTTDGTISEAAAPCTSPMVRNFAVGAGTVTDINLGVLLAHVYRWDVTMVLQSPAGTRVTVIQESGGDFDNFNVLLDDANTTSIYVHPNNDTATALTTVPPYQRTGIYAPFSPLSAFNGQSAAGTWRLEICDTFIYDDGTFFQADLYVTTVGIINCPAGSTATGSGFTSSGTGANLNRIFWLDWSCGGTGTFPAGSTVNKTWSAGDGLVLTGQVSAITQSLRPYNVGEWVGDILDDMYAGLNPIGLRNAVEGGDPQFTLTFSATLNGAPVALRYVLADAEDSAGTTADESIAATTNGTAWTQLETAGSVTVINAGTTVTIYDPANGGGGSAVMETSASALSLSVNMISAGGTATAFGFYAPYDYSDAPTTGTTYGAANHRTIASFRMGTLVTSEAAAYDNPTASADTGDDGVALPELVRGQAAAIPVAVSAGGFLSGWIDFNDDGDFADAGEQVATNAVDGGTGDTDGAVNGIIRLSVTPPAGAATTPTIARFRYASVSGAAISGLYGYGEVEDYGLSILTPGLSVTKISSLISDPVNGSGAGRMAIPGAVIEYCIQISNTGTATATNIVATDTLPTTTAYVTGSLLSGGTCAVAITAEDEDATGADESDLVGASVSGSALSASAATLSSGSGMAVKFRATIN